MMNNNEDNPMTNDKDARIAALEANLAATTKERDAYNKAKQENDERFMIERDEARAALAESRERVAGLVAALEPFAIFAKNDGVFRNKGDELYTEHGKVEAVFRRSDCLRASSAISNGNYPLTT